jgi:hypothetical protein
MRKSMASAPAPLETRAPPQPGDYAEFLRTALPQQAKAVASHRFGSERVWLKKAGPRHGKLRYHLLALVSGVLRLDVLAPVPNPGGDAAIAMVHAREAYLSQAFDRNLVQCPDGTIGYIDFEDDPGETLPLAECQARDWLSYLHSTAMLVDAASPHAAEAHWHAVLDQASAEVRDRLAVAAQRMRWLRHLPAGRRWGRDTQRVRAVARLLARWYGR